MLLPFITGFSIGMSLIVAIGAQNAFVLRQGMTGKHVFYIALFCAVSDSILIILGISGASVFLNKFMDDFSNYLFGLTSLWLFGYGVMRLKSSFKVGTFVQISYTESKNLKQTIVFLSILTFANPHVYLDTMVLIGALSQQFTGVNRNAFGLGAIFASFIFFFSLSYGAKFLRPKMQNPISWCILDFFIALIMFTIAIKLAIEGNWL